MEHQTSVMRSRLKPLVIPNLRLVAWCYKSASGTGVQEHWGAKGLRSLTRSEFWLTIAHWPRKCGCVKNSTSA
jgi:hypothetical protein